jgi:hypothetical protein
LIPRGALVVDAAKKVIPSTNFNGLSYQTASEKRAYLHYRKPESLQGIALLRKPGLVTSGDFLDCIDKDAPAGTSLSLSLSVSLSLNPTHPNPSSSIINNQLLSNSLYPIFSFSYTSYSKPDCSQSVESRQAL